MLLDTIKINNADELNDALRLMFDSTAFGYEQVSWHDIVETNCAIGIELSLMLMREYNTDPQKAWHSTLSILRLLPWKVDPEKARAQSNKEIVDAIYRYFGGLEWTELDYVFGKLRDMAEQGEPWRDIVKYACQELENKV